MRFFEHRGRSIRTTLTSILVLGFILLCVWPYVGLARSPSLFDDDLTRVGSLRQSTVASSLFRPFNEHLAPLFELVSWFAWWGTGERVETIATGFLVASYTATAFCAFTLAAVIWVESNSMLAALAAVALFFLESVAAETVLWYSASSFAWSAATSLAAWYASVRALRADTSADQRWWLAGSALFALMSPLFSAIGILGGPLASFRLLIERRWSRARLAAALVPLVGTLGFLLLLAANPGLGQAVSVSVRQHADITAASWAALRAPGLVLVPSLIGLPPHPYRLSDLLATLTTITMVVAVIGWASHNRARRGLILVGLGWVIGGYSLAYLNRAQAGDRWIFEIGRYHLFPIIGQICWVAAGLGTLLDRIAARWPLAGWVGLILLAVGELILQGPTLNDLAHRTSRFPDQPESIAAALRLETVCHAEQVPLDQAIRVIDPIEPRWFPRPLPFNPLLYLFGRELIHAHWTDIEARQRLLANLSFADRESIFGGLDATRYEVADSDEDRASKQTRVAESGRGTMTEIGNFYFIEFSVPPTIGGFRSLALTGFSPGQRVEIYWTADGDNWSRGRSVRYKTSLGRQPIAVDLLPHWRTGLARRFRVVRRASPLRITDQPALIFRSH